MDLLKDRSANVVVAFALALPVLAAATGAAVDYGRIASAQSRLQVAADAAALAAVRELRLAGRQDEAVKSIAKDIAAAELGDTDFDFSASINAHRDRLVVNLGQTIETLVLPSSDDSPIRASAEALVQGGTPVCLLGLVPAGKGAVSVRVAKVKANGCAIYSNSSSAAGIDVKQNGQIEADLVCSGGGVANNGTINPDPTYDCPAVADPIAGRAPPPVGPCTYTDYTVAVATILLPGTYCGGLHINGPSVVTFTPGVYVIKDGPLTVEDNAVVVGTGVGFYLTGTNAVFHIEPRTTVSLTSPVSGPLAGMLFFEDRTNAPGKHKIDSRDAPLLLGTIYLPVSSIEIGNPLGSGLLTGKLGALSAWTIVVAQDISINDGLTLTLNSNYSATTVPVPVGFGEGAIVTLTK